jgi:hypothetical protein
MIQMTDPCNRATVVQDGIEAVSSLSEIIGRIAAWLSPGTYGRYTCNCLRRSPLLTPVEIMREVVLAVDKGTVNSPRTRLAVAISLRSTSATQAHMSRMMEVKQGIAIVFADRVGNSLMDEIQPRLLATLTLSTMNLAVPPW